MKLKRRVEILPGLKADIGICCMETERETETEIRLKIHPKIIQGAETVEYILNFAKEFAEEFYKIVLRGGINWECYNKNATIAKMKQEIAIYEKCLVTIPEAIQSKIAIHKNILKILETKGGERE